MRGNDFRRVVLGMPGTIEASHMAHPDFRAHGRIFATLNAEETRGVVMLTPEQQQNFLADHAAMFSPCPGAWGEAGSTYVHLDAADEDTVGEAVTLAWQNAAVRLRSRQAAKAAAKKKPTGTKKRTATTKRAVSRQAKRK
jgi:hypothetical protein